MDPTTEIASKFTVANFEKLRSQLTPDSPLADAWPKIIEVFQRRIEERFIVPIDRLMHADGSSTRSVPGFAILSLDCLLIDTIQSFREGRVTTGEVSPAQSFKAFLNGGRFRDFNSNDRDDFFNYVRNGLLHNGETRGDWKVRVDLPKMLTKAPSGTRTINRKLFHRAIVQEFEKYCGQLVSGSADVRVSFLRRMDAICGHAPKPCSYYFAYGSNLLDSEIKTSAPNAAAESIAYLPGWRLTFNKHSKTRERDAANIERCASQMVWGFVYRVSAENKNELIRREVGYKEQRVNVLLVDDVTKCEKCTPVQAFTFVGEKECPDTCGPSEAYLNLVLDGAKRRGLPKDYIQRITLKK